MADRHQNRDIFEQYQQLKKQLFSGLSTIWE
jgi:hypothetical protein